MKMKMNFLIAMGAILLLIAGCCNLSGDASGSSRATRYTCDDGRIVPDISQCTIDSAKPEPSIPPGTISEPSIVEVGQTGVPIQTDIDAKDAFDAYVLDSNLDYEYVDSEYYKTEGEIDYYKVTYSHNDVSGGQRQLVVDSTGKIYELYAAI